MKNPYNHDELDRAYAEASAFDAAMFDKWIHENFTILCKRTERPKLGHFIKRLNDAGICCVEHGASWHAPLLWVMRADYAAAAAVTIDVPGLDDMPDDDESFLPDANTKPDAELQQP